MISPTPTIQDHVSNKVVDITRAGESLELLSFIGGICTIVGVAVLVITRGSMGIRAIIIGVCLVILNFAIANYLSWFLIPVLVATGIVSMAWAFVTVRQLLKSKECKNVSINK